MLFPPLSVFCLFSFFSFVCVPLDWYRVVPNTDDGLQIQRMFSAYGF